MQYYELQEADWFEAIRLFMASFSPAPFGRFWRYTRHKCSCNCKFFQYKTIYICQTTGDYHVCTQATCDAKIHTDENMVCTLTGLCYPLDFQVEHGYDNAGWTKRDTLSQTPAVAKMAAPTTPPGAVNRKRVRPSPKTSPARVPVRKFTTTDQSQHKLTGTAVTIIQQVFQNIVDNQGKSVLQSLNVQQLAEVCRQTWCDIMQTETLKQKKFKYKEEYHCMIVLYEMVDGVQLQDRIIIPQNATIKRYLPPVKNIKHIHGFTAKRMTSIQGIYRACMSEVLSRLVV